MNRFPLGNADLTHNYTENSHHAFTGPEYMDGMGTGQVARTSQLSYCL